MITDKKLTIESLCALLSAMFLIEISLSNKQENFLKANVFLSASNSLA